MTRLFFAIPFALGAAAILWTAAGFIGSAPLALVVTATIGGVYVLGAGELYRYRQATNTLTSALHSLPERGDDPDDWLATWLQRLHPSLHNAVRLRIEGDRGGLPAPVFTPYLVGLLVMLGLLGTFIGMVETLGGAVLALEGSTELEAVRAGLAAPIKGLGVAFGTSVAGVAASAMLGLVSTACRRERMLATRQLDRAIAGPFREFSASYQRQATLQVLQQQAQALPAVAERLQALASDLQGMGQQLGERLQDGQRQFHDAASAVYTELAASVGESLRASLARAGREAGEAIQPVVATAMADLQRDSRDLQQQLAATASGQLAAYREEATAGHSAMLAAFDRTAASWSEQTLALRAGMAEAMQASAGELAASTSATAAALLAEIAGVLRSAEELVQARQASERAWLDVQQEQMAHLTGTLRTELAGLRAAQESGQQAAVAGLAELEAGVARHLAELGRGLEEPMQRLMTTASETPRAAAEVISQLRAEISANIERDQQMLEQRAQVMAQLNSLADALEGTAGRQREAIEQLVSTSSGTLQDISARFSEQADSSVSRLSEVAAHFRGGAAELASLGEAFNAGIELFNTANGRLAENLARIEESMGASAARSDEQMGYYIAQAREIIDQSMLSQQGIIEDLRRLGAATPDAEARAGAG
ncbi:MAG: hypothetical protein KDI05_16425 [Halieaceae bacterium]|nr:hypothetical protein [Halieaceae bacterium]